MIDDSCTTGVRQARDRWNQRPLVQIEEVQLSARCEAKGAVAPAPRITRPNQGAGPEASCRTCPVWATIDRKSVV